MVPTPTTSATTVVPAATIRTNQTVRQSMYQAPTIPTAYMVMSIQANEIPMFYNIRAAFFSWITFAGYIVLPGTFTSVSRSESLQNIATGRLVQNVVKNIPLLPTAGFCFVVGITGSYLLWKKWKSNYIWLVAKLFVPGFFHALAGLLTTIVNIYSAHDGNWSVTAFVTAALISTLLSAHIILIILYTRKTENIKIPLDRSSLSGP